MFIVRRSKGEKGQEGWRGCFHPGDQSFFEDKCQRRVWKLTKEVQKLALKGAFDMQCSYIAYVKTLNV